ncbi:hypothetical protein AAHA92_01454 [Salvia divinorum]|uniref:Uncharacterized protein n=1 Tax=Salvia divinorum TaxID=28513 RepID=A0ABD1ID33_SALDI
MSNIHHGELLAVDHQIELLRAQKELLMKMENQEETYMERGLRFTLLWSTFEDTMHYHSFDELGLNACTDRDLVISGFKRNLETSPICVGLFRVGDAMFMAGGEAIHPHSSPVTRWQDIHLRGTSEQEGLAELFDPDKGEFDSKNFRGPVGCPNPISCFQWTDQVVMVYYQDWVYGEDSFKSCKPSLLSYNIVEDSWDKFEENLPPPLCKIGKRNLVYVGGGILFIIDFACLWFVYDLSSRKQVGDVCVNVRPRGKRVQVVEALYAGDKDVKSTSWVFYIFMNAHGDYYRDLEYAKVGVVQGKGGDYFSTVQMRGVLKVGPFNDIHIFAEKDNKGNEKIDDKQVNESL